MILTISWREDGLLCVYTYVRKRILRIRRIYAKIHSQNWCATHPEQVSTPREEDISRSENACTQFVFGSLTAVTPQWLVLGYKKILTTYLLHTSMSCSCDEYDNDERSLVPSRKKRRILMNNKMVEDQHNPVVVANKNKKEAAAPPVLDVFTAVVLKVNDNNDNSGNTQGEEPANNNNNEDDDSCFVAPAQSLYLFKTFSILLGLLIGAFIQFSSLGANYLVEQIGWQHHHHPQQQQEQEEDSPYQSAWWGWALVWSMGTSTVGVLVLLALRSLLQEIGTPTGSLSNNISNNNNKIRPHQQQRVLLLLIMECHFAVGARKWW